MLTKLKIKESWEKDKNTLFPDYVLSTFKIWLNKQVPDELKRDTYEDMKGRFLTKGLTADLVDSTIKHWGNTLDRSGAVIYIDNPNRDDFWDEINDGYERYNIVRDNFSTCFSLCIDDKAKELFNSWRKEKYKTEISEAWYDDDDSDFAMEILNLFKKWLENKESFDTSSKSETLKFEAAAQDFMYNGISAEKVEELIKEYGDELDKQGVSFSDPTLLNHFDFWDIVNDPYERFNIVKANVEMVLWEDYYDEAKKAFINQYNKTASKSIVEVVDLDEDLSLDNVDAVSDDSDKKRQYCRYLINHELNLGRPHGQFKTNSRDTYNMALDMLKNGGMVKIKGRKNGPAFVIDYERKAAANEALAPAELNSKQVSSYVWNKIRKYDDLIADNSKFWDFEEDVCNRIDAKLLGGDDAVKKLPEGAIYKFSLINKDLELNFYLYQDKLNLTWYVVDSAYQAIKETFETTCDNCNKTVTVDSNFVCPSCNNSLRSRSNDCVEKIKDPSSNYILIFNDSDIVGKANKELLGKGHDTFGPNAKVVSVTKEFFDTLKPTIHDRTTKNSEYGSFTIDELDKTTRAIIEILKSQLASEESIDSRDQHESLAAAGYEPKVKGTAYKVFKIKNGKLYPPMVANPNNEPTPVGVWLTADEGEFAGLSKTGRPQVKSTQSSTLSYRPGFHLGDYPRAKQFDRTNKETGEKEFPKDFIWAECEYTMDIDYQAESDEQGHIRHDKNGNVYRSDKYQHSLAGLPKLPKDGYYKYRTNPRPDTIPWIITGAVKVNRLLDDFEVNKILELQGIQPIHRQGGDKTLAELGFSND